MVTAVSRTVVPCLEGGAEGVFFAVCLVGDPLVPRGHLGVARQKARGECRGCSTLPRGTGPGFRPRDRVRREGTGGTGEHRRCDGRRPKAEAGESG